MNHSKVDSDAFGKIQEAQFDNPIGERLDFSLLHGEREKTIVIDDQIGLFSRRVTIHRRATFVGTTRTLENPACDSIAVGDQPLLMFRRPMPIVVATEQIRMYAD
jgi:hypothetical protein